MLCGLYRNPVNLFLYLFYWILLQKLHIMATEDQYLDPMNFQVINPSVFDHVDRPIIVGVGGGSK